MKDFLCAWIDDGCYKDSIIYVIIVLRQLSYSTTGFETCGFRIQTDFFWKIEWIWLVIFCLPFPVLPANNLNFTVIHFGQ